MAKYTQAEALDLVSNTDLQTLQETAMKDLKGLWSALMGGQTAPKFGDKDEAVQQLQDLAADPSSLPEPAPAKAKAKGKGKGRPPAKAVEFWFNPERGTDKVANQAEVIYRAVEKDVWIPEATLREQIEQLKQDGTLVTRQDSWRIFQYYRPTLNGFGVLKIRTAETPEADAAAAE